MPDDLPEPQRYRPAWFLRAGGVIVCFVAATPSLCGLGMFLFGGQDEDRPVSLLFALVLGGGGLWLLFHWWRLSTELGRDELIMHGPLRTRRYLYSDLGGIAQIQSSHYSKYGRRTTRSWKLLDRNRKPIANVEWIRLLRGSDQFVERLRQRI